LEVLAHAGEVDELLDAGSGEDGAAADAGQFEQAGALDRAGGEDNLLVGFDDGAVLEGDAGGDLLLASPLEVDLDHALAG
jgi:hypothetical protein